MSGKIEAWIICGFLITIWICGAWYLATTNAPTINNNLKEQIIQLQSDRDEIKLHTDQLAEIVKIQQYQIDVLTESISDDIKQYEQHRGGMVIAP